MVSKSYVDLLSTLKEKIRRARSLAVLTVNSQMLSVYWEIGEVIDKLSKEGGYGSKTIEKMAADLKSEFPDMEGLGVRSLRYMREFHKAYPEFMKLQQAAAILPEKKNKTTAKNKTPILQQAAAKLPEMTPSLISLIPWGHHQIILDKTKTRQERLFYIQKTIENGWNRKTLILHIQNSNFDRQGKSITNFDLTIPANESDLLKETFKNPYLLDFLDIRDEMKEKDLEQALIRHMKKFLLELGRGFSYVGNQFNIQVEGDDFFLDLLFFNYNINCFVVFELKVGDFKPEYAGKLNFYINAVDEQIKNKKHNHTIGVLLCQTPNKTVVRYALEGVKKPIAVSDYKLSKALPKELKSEMPSIEEWEQELQEEIEKLKTPTDKRFEAFKRKISSFKKEQVENAASFDILISLFRSSIHPLFETLLIQLKEFSQYFLSTSHLWYSGSYNSKSLEELTEFWMDEHKLRANKEIHFQYRMSGLKPAGVETFDIVVQLVLVIDLYTYGFILSNHNGQQPYLKKLYGQDLSSSEIKGIGDLIRDQVMDRIEPYL